MLASIITPTFNAISFLEQCVRNVREQGDAVGEHIIVDGGSTDGTVELARTLAQADSRLILIEGPDKGQSDAMNKATLAARFDVIGILNVDDYYEPGTVAEATAILDSAPAIGLVAANTCLIDEHGAVINWNRPHDLRPAALMQQSHHFEFPANPSAYFYRRAVHDAVGGYDIQNHYTMDIDFLLKALKLCKACYTDRHWGNFRILPGTKSFTNANNNDPLGEIIDIHYRKLSRIEKAKTRLIWIENDLRVRAWGLLHKFGLR